MAALSHYELQDVREAAHDLRETIADNIRQAIGLHVAKRRELVFQERERALAGLRNHVGTARLSAGDLQAVCGLLNTEEYKAMQFCELADGRGSALAPPLPQEAALFEEKVNDMLEIPSAPHPWWCKYVCPHRSRFHGVALAKGQALPHGQANPQQYWLLLFAKQQPYQRTFLRPLPMHRSSSKTSWLASLLPNRRRNSRKSVAFLLSGS